MLLNVLSERDTQMLYPLVFMSKEFLLMLSASTGFFFFFFFLFCGEKGIIYFHIY